MELIVLCGVGTFVLPVVQTLEYLLPGAALRVAHHRPPEAPRLLPRPAAETRPSPVAERYDDAA